MELKIQPDCCAFQFKYECQNKKEALITSEIYQEGNGRISNVIVASRHYSDGLHSEIEKHIDQHPNFRLNFHKSCVSKYTTKRAYQKLAKTQDSPSTPLEKMPRRSNAIAFQIKKDCLYCAAHCDLQCDPKNPNRWDPAYKFASLKIKDNHEENSKKKLKALVDIIIDQCMKRGDDWGNQVQVRLNCCGDLVAAEGRYHVECRTRFNVGRMPRGQYKPKSQKLDEACIDTAFDSTIKKLKKEKGMYNSKELFTIYSSEGGGLYDESMKKQLYDDIESHLAGSVITLHSNGYAKILIFKEKAMSSL